MADFPLPELAQLRERVRDLEGEIARLRRGEDATSHPSDQALVESEERFRVAFATAPAGMSITRVSDGKILFVNPAFCQNSGRSEEEIVGRTMEDIDLYADEEQRQHVFAQIIAQGFIENEEFRYKNRAGEVRVGLLSSRPITLRGEVCQLGLLIDVTEAKRVEAERAKLEERLRQAEKMEAIGRLAGGVAHDFNNMLTAISANVELGLMKSEPRALIRENLTEIGDIVQRAAQLTRQLLAFSRKQVLEPQPIDLSAKVSEVQTMLHRVIGEGISLTFDLAPNLPRVMADPSQIEQVILNLVVNARDAVAPRGSISVVTRASTRLPGDGARFVVLSVTDDGKGIAPDVVPHVFEPFFSTKSARGTGLGLSTVEGVVTQHGGFVELDTSPGKGTTFRVFLPEAPPDAGVRAANRTKSPAPPKQLGTLLLAEDDASVREPTARLLQLLGFTVRAAASASAALGEARAHAIDVLVTDVVMPDMNGPELARAVRGVHPTAAVVFMSGYVEDTLDRGDALTKDAVVLRKPFGAEQLLDAIARARGGRA